MTPTQCDGRPTPTLDDLRWEDGKKFRYDCASLTSLLRGQVPVLAYVNWGFDLIEQGRTRSVLPLVNSSTNQHCTHQAALLFLAADYTGGIALASLLPDWPLVGIHPIAPSEKSMSLWLVKGEIKYFRPSVGRLEISASVEPARHHRVRNRCAQGKKVLETVTVRFRNGDVDVAEAQMTYYGRQSDKLRDDGAAPNKVNILFEHKIISSAELISGVRARESGRLFDDPWAARMAGEHGLALATRFCEKMPQLAGMVAARTRHLDLQIQEYVRNGGRDLVLAGAGFDMRPFRLNLPSGMNVYELDLPTMLIDRQRRLLRINVETPAHVNRVQVPIDLRSTTLAEALKDRLDFMSPIFIAWEGMSMYFFPEVKDFMTCMQLLGEPFVFGVDSAKDFIEGNGMTCHQTVCSDIFLCDQPDPVYSIYHFCTASAEAMLLPTGEQSSWIAHAAHAPLPSAITSDADQRVNRELR
jgi:acyl-coenzyme A thioesterase PaaI-like protein